MNASWAVYAWIAAGGAIGASMRFYFTQLAITLFGKQFPFGTLCVNVMGSFIIAIIYGLIERGDLEAMPYRFFIGVGLLGALTTFSTFSFETLALINNGLWLKAVINLFSNVLLCLLATFIGVQLIKG